MRQYLLYSSLFLALGLVIFQLYDNTKVSIPESRVSITAAVSTDNGGILLDGLSNLQRVIENWWAKIYNTSPVVNIGSTISCRRLSSGVTVNWSCADTSTVANAYSPSGDRINTHGATIGSVYLKGAKFGKYKLVCIKNKRVISESFCKDS